MSVPPCCRPPDLKVDGLLGPWLEDARAVRSLNKQIRLHPGVGAEIEADTRHAEITRT